MFTEQVQPKSTGRAAQRERTRAGVLEAAQRLFAEQGFRATTIRQIATAAGVSVGTVMAVGDKDALLVAVFDRRIGAVHEARADGREAPPSGTPAARIGALVQPFLDMFGADPALAREYGAILARGTTRAEVFTDLAVALTAEFAAVFRDAGLGADAESAGRAAYLAYLGLLMASPSLRTGMGSIRDQLEDVVGLLADRDSKDPHPKSI
ncbi:TetR/AcrR family transcriptional regulator [Mycolicibacterium brumae]|uniref:TetR/AcrR family transcriptional regulator n=1 Tax=Mycolicibacterium brumae TaxID=85968 RepID=A0A2G5PGW8_9MYCO|nr:TetR/AcrR family transcriptional regulator [Mycolicibacterium brumae]MCV7194395.1 TetR/AcrR family transcriptional regulator [Mycolicibacterium brumae]PIB77214.1 TetR/AcrR family transcriptional regulator [Mycolicibacterium brumae]RWA15454.1 hypothetical protein MBRU_10415 [Mycolicibacterium brumae DSM 44177]UWW10567.1 TetR/AcrR family transcriptional regulator [Mycolicibacterium brumae]